jgi:hypothetical protein
VPTLRGATNRLLRRGPPRRFRDSASYWDERYRRRSDSGVGSYGRLAEFKAEVVNQLAAGRPVIEWGSGDGAQLALFEVTSYVGVDVSSTAIENCRRRYAGDLSRTFLTLEEAHEQHPTAPVALSLDVIYHLVEDDVYSGYMRDLFGSATEAVIVYSSNIEASDQSAAHVRHRRFTDWVAEYAPNWVLDEHIPNRYPWDPELPEATSFSDFHVFRPFHEGT